MNRILRSQLPQNPRDIAVFDTTTGSSPGRTRWMRMKKTCFALLALVLMLTSTSSFAQSFATIGGTSATTSSSTGSDPIDGFYASMRYQVVYTAAELTTAGMVPNSSITGLGFSISADYAGGNLNGYTIGLGHTTATDAATHNTAATSTVKNAFAYNPTVVALGSFDMIAFDNSFVWNGSSNILINICTPGPNAYLSPYGQVRIITATSGSRYVRSDLGTQCAVNTANANSNKPAIRFAYSPPPACAGLPNAGTAAISSSSGCAGVSVNLSATGLSAEAGLTYQWQNSTDGGTNWTNISGATSSTYSLAGGVSVSTSFRIVTTCSNSGLSANSSSVSYQVNTCQASITMTDSFGDGWDGGGFVTLNVDGSAYRTFTLASGLTQTVNFCTPQNASYALVYTNTGASPGEVGLSFSINGGVAYSAAAGTMTAGATLNSGTACPPPCSGTPTAAVTAFTGASSICFGQTKTMTGTGISNSPGISVEWKVSSTSGGSYTAVNGGIGSTTASYTTPSSQGVGTYYYVLVTTCSNSGLTSTSDEIALTINALPTVVLTAPNGGAFCGTQLMTVSGASTYAWTPTASLNATTGTSVYFTGTANATVSVTGTDLNGCSAAVATQNVTYTEPAPITASSSVTKFCGTGGTTTISASSSAPYTYVFEALDGAVLSNTTATTVDATVSQTSAIRVTGTDAASGCASQSIVSVGLYPLPDAVVTTSADGVCPGTSATIYSGLSAGTFSVSPTPYNYMTPPPTANAGPSGDDVVGGPYSIGFSYDYFGTIYNSFYISTNGNIQFGPTTSTSYTPGSIPSTVAPNNFVALGWADLNAPAGSIKYWVQGYSPNRILIIDFNAIPFFGGAAGTSESGQIRLYETLGMVEVHLTNSNGLASTGGGVKSLGVENPDGTIGAAAPGRNNSAWTTSTPEAWRFSPPANYLTTWSATDANGTYNLNTGYPSSPTNSYYTPVLTVNGFSATVAPAITTTYAISYANATTGCSNQLTPEQVTMSVLGTVAPQGVSATSTVTTVCPGVNIPLSTSYTGSIAGLTFQWQVSIDAGGSWTDIAGATAATYTATQTSASSYRVGITSCGGAIEYTSPVAVALAAFVDCYCTPASLGGTGTLINEVSVNATFTNNSSATNPVASPYYTNYSTLPGTPAVAPGVVMNLSLTLEAAGPLFNSNIISVWIDYNHSGTYEASEWTQFGTAVPSGATTTVGITIPTSALPGNTGMRIRTRGAGNANGSADACTTTFGSGETEDYFINILGPCDPVLFIAPFASADDIDATVCGTQTSQLTATNPNNSANPIYMWYDAPTGGILLQNSTVGSYTPAAIAATTTWYVAINTGTCITDRSPVTLNWVAPPAITASNSNPESCGVAGSSTDLSASSTNAGYTYSWSASPAAGSGLTAGTTGSTVSGVTPTGSGVYTYTATAVDAAGCSTTASTTVNVYALPAAPTSVTGGSTCLNGNTLNVSGTVITPGTLTYSLGTNISSNGPAFTAGTATIALPSGATVTSASLVFTNVEAFNGSYLSEIRSSLSGAATLAPTAISTLGFGVATIATTTLAIPGASGITNGLVTFTLSESLDDFGVDATFGDVSLVINYTLSSLPSWFNNSVASAGSFVGTGSPFNVAGTSILPSTAVSGSATAYAANVVTIGALTCYSPTVAAAVSVGQPLTVSVAASSPITQTFSLATNYSVAAGATQTLTGSVAIPAGAVVTSTVLRLNGVTTTDWTWGNDVSISMSGASNLSSQFVLNADGELTNDGPYTYTASNIVSPGGVVNITFVHALSWGGPMDIATVDLLVTYSAPLTGNVCPGTPVTLNAITTGGGSNPVYQWSLNGAPISGANSASYLATPLASEAFTVSVTDDCNTVAVTSAPYSQPFFTVTAGSISGPSAINVNDFTSTPPGGGTYNITGQNAGSAIQWSSGAVSTGPYTTIADATGASQNLYPYGPAGTIYLTATTTTTDGCSIQANVVTVVLGNALDLACNAYTLSAGNQGGLLFSTAASTIEAGEIAGFSTSTRSIWFKFVAPASGRVSMETSDNGTTDNYMRIFSTTDCSSISSFTQLFSDDDSGTGANAFIANAKCLVPGQTYYVQVSPYGATTTAGAYTMTLTELSNTAPVITNVSANITALAITGTCAATATWAAPLATDDQGCVTMTSNFNSGASFPVGVTTVTYTATDAQGLVTTASFTVTVNDTQLPTVTAPAAVTVIADLNSCTATATLGSATTADNCGVASTTNNAPATFPIGNTTVTYTVTDVNGNVATATQLVTVEVNPANIWYVDADGDNYGVAGATVTACSQPVGYAANTTDCNDANVNVNPGEIEICGNTIDDNCNGASEEGCLNPGENPSNATSMSTSIWPNCNAINGILDNATVSGSALTSCLTGEDKWHQFVATSEGVSIVVNSTSADILIELQTAAGVLVAQENEVSGLGGEILNHYGLTAGQVYKIGVRNYNSALGAGTYSICAKMLKRGGCDFGPGPYTLCQYFKATWAGATGTSYTFTYTGVSGPASGNVYTRTQNSNICVLSSVLPTLPYGSTYNVLISNTYTLTNGAGVAEVITVPGLAPCSMSTATQPVTALRTSDRCTAGPRFRGSIVASLPWVCGVTNWLWEFTELDEQGNPGGGLPLIVERDAASNYLNLGIVLPLQYGKTYAVRTAPVFSYGTGAYGPVQNMCIIGSAGMVLEGASEMAQNSTRDMLVTNESNLSLYPNPTHGTDVNINLSGVTSENVQIRVVDAMGRQVWSNRYSVDGILNTNITFERPLANGLYMVEAIFNGEVQTQRMMVQK